MRTMVLSLRQVLNIINHDKKNPYNGCLPDDRVDN